MKLCVPKTKLTKQILRLPRPLLNQFYIYLIHTTFCLNLKKQLVELNQLRYLIVTNFGMIVLHSRKHKTQSFINRRVFGFKNVLYSKQTNKL